MRRYFSPINARSVNRYTTLYRRRKLNEAYKSENPKWSIMDMNTKQKAVDLLLQCHDIVDTNKLMHDVFYYHAVFERVGIYGIILYDKQMLPTDYAYNVLLPKIKQEIQKLYQINKSDLDDVYDYIVNNNIYPIYDESMHFVICEGFNEQKLAAEVSDDKRPNPLICEHRESDEAYEFYFNILKKYNDNCKFLTLDILKSFKPDFNRSICNKNINKWLDSFIPYNKPDYSNTKSVNNTDNHKNSSRISTNNKINLSNRRKPNAVYSVRYVNGYTDGMPLSYCIDELFYTVHDAYNYIISQNPEYGSIFNCVDNEVYTYDESTGNFALDTSYGNNWSESNIGEDNYIIEEIKVEGQIRNNKVWCISAFIDYVDGDPVAYMFYLYGTKKLAENAKLEFVEDDTDYYDPDEIDDAYEEAEETYDITEYTIH